VTVDSSPVFTLIGRFRPLHGEVGPLFVRPSMRLLSI
jgi:hypothetical protein